jgi:hypothetical protein
VQDLLNLVGNVGFPIAVAAFLLVRIESKIACLTNAIAELREAILTMPRDQSAAALQPVRAAAREVV